MLTTCIRATALAGLARVHCSEQVLEIRDFLAQHRKVLGGGNLLRWLDVLTGSTDPYTQRARRKGLVTFALLRQKGCQIARRRSQAA